MSTDYKPSRLIPAVAVPEGAGVTVQRSIGSPALRNYDPFMLLDYFSSDNPDDYIAGFPDHPHRGFNTFTYMLDGHMQHRDSMGNTGDLGPGSAQWMKAASGIIHSEMPQQEHGLMRGFQLWINLPAAHKMDNPEYQEYEAEAFPVITSDGSRIKVLIGQYEEHSSPIVDDISEVSYLDVQLEADQVFQHSVAGTHNSFIYLFEGSGTLGDQTLPLNSFISLGTADQQFALTAGTQGVRFLVVSGRPINESVVQYGPFVMNDREEIDQAIKDFQSNHFVRDRAWVNRS